MDTLRHITICALAALALLSAAYAQSKTNAGTFTDGRDGKTYRTVVIGKQRWMAENLNFKTERSVCYENKESNCKKYGRLYDWNDARTACPAGWRVPSDGDWNDLAKAVGGKRVEPDDGYYYWEDAGKNLKSRIGWNYNNDDDIHGNGTDDYDFSALPGGLGWGNGRFNSAGDHGGWWSAKDNGNTYARYWHVYYGNTRVRWGSHNKYNLFSLRCVM